MMKRFRVVLKDFTRYVIQADNLTEARKAAFEKYGKKNVYTVYWEVVYD